MNNNPQLIDWLLVLGVETKRINVPADFVAGVIVCARPLVVVLVSSNTTLSCGKNCIRATLLVIIASVFARAITDQLLSFLPTLGAGFVLVFLPGAFLALAAYYSTWIWNPN